MTRKTLTQQLAELHDRLADLTEDNNRLIDQLCASADVRADMEQRLAKAETLCKKQRETILSLRAGTNTGWAKFKEAKASLADRERRLALARKLFSEQRARIRELEEMNKPW